MRTQQDAPGRLAQADNRDRVNTVVFGEFVRGFSHRGWTCHRLVVTPEHKVANFALRDDEVLSEVSVAVVVPLTTEGPAAPTGGGAGGAVLAFGARIARTGVDRQAMAEVWRERRSDAMRVTAAGGTVVVPHLNGVEARTSAALHLDQYLTGDSADLAPLIAWGVAQIDALREELRPLLR